MFLKKGIQENYLSQHGRAKPAYSEMFEKDKVLFRWNMVLTELDFIQIFN